MNFTFIWKKKKKIKKLTLNWHSVLYSHSPIYYFARICIYVFCLLSSQSIKLFGLTVIYVAKIKHTFSPRFILARKKRNQMQNCMLVVIVYVCCVCVFSVVATSQLVDSNMLKAFLFFFILMLPYSSLKCWPNQCLHLWTFPVNGHRFLLNITHTNWHKICKIFGLFQQRARCKKIIISNKWSNWREKPITKKKTENETVKWFVLSVST